VQPIIGIQKSHGLHPKANGVKTTDQPWGGAKITMGFGQHNMVGLPIIDGGPGLAIGHQYVQARIVLGQNRAMAWQQQIQGLLAIGSNHSHKRPMLAWRGL
jgi:hypothetical protein